MCPSKQQTETSGCKRMLAVQDLEQQTAAPSRKRVRFQNTRMDHQVLELIPQCAEISPEEKALRWIQTADREEIRRSANMEARECRMEDQKWRLRGQSHLAFSELYTSAYAACHLSEQDNNATDDILQIMSADSLLLMAQSQSRGLEDRKVPHIAIQRRLSRKQAIQLVLQVQFSAGSEPERIRHASESLTGASRKFAEVLGITDATAAMMEYSAIVNASDDSKSPDKEANNSAAGMTSAAA